jgi:signal transduction histidine kinase
MHAERMLARMREVEAYVGWSEDDARRIAEAAPRLGAALPALVDDFYAAIDGAPEVRALLTGGPEQTQRLRASLARWLEELLSGPYDAGYLTRRYRVGLRHVEIGVDPMHTSAAMARLRAGLVRALHASWPAGRGGLAETARALHRRLDLDHALITHAYQSELLDRAQRVERLATLGQIAGGVAHELRNPLNVVKTSVYYLRNARTATPAKVAEHLERIERHVDVANAVITALSSFARSPAPSVRPTRLDRLVEEALEMNRPPETVAVERTFGAEPAWSSCDPDQLGIVLGNLLRNAYDAMPRGGTLRLAIRRDGASWALEVGDDGEGIAPEDLARILEPLYSTKARGLGLGLAIARSLVEKNQGRLTVRSRSGEGSTFTVLLPAVEPPV